MLRISFISFILISTIACNSKVSHSINEVDKIDTTQVKQLINSYINGKMLFEKKCATCHYPPGEGDPPLLSNLFDRLPQPSEKYFIEFIQDSKRLKESGDEYANRSYEMWPYKFDHNFKDSLSTLDFKSLIDYIKVAGNSK